MAEGVTRRSTGLTGGTVALVLLVAALAGCGSVRVDRSSAGPAVTAAEALEFGELALPPAGRVLAVDGDHGIDSIYRLVIELPRDEVETMLARSDFTGELREPGPVTGSAVDGYDPADATDVASAQDRLPATDERPSVYRDVLVDRSEPARALVYWWLFTT